MIRELSERLELMKFVSRETVSAVRAADAAGVARGGERRRVALLFSDIRGYTAFTEAVAPEVVVEMLNQYLEVQTAIVEGQGGDVDKFIGDALVAVFQGPTWSATLSPTGSRSSARSSSCSRRIRTGTSTSASASRR
jgi:adenylate cyclase